MFRSRESMRRRATKGTVNNTRILAVLVLLEIALFVADILVINDDISFGFAYIIPMVITFYLSDRRYPIIIAILAVLFTAIGTFIPMPEDDKLFTVIANRAIAVFVILLCLSLVRYRLLFIETLQEIIREEREMAAAQKAFVVTISHEFRTPLTAIDGHAQRLIMGASQDYSSVARRAQKIRAAVSRILVLVDSIMHANRLEQAQLQFNPVNFDLRDIIHESCQRQLEATAEVEINIDVPDTPIAITGDPILIGLVLGNLLSNAVKFSSNSASVEVSARCSDGRVVVIVKDHGRGIPRDELARLFDRYFRASNALTTQGSGVGLHLARELVRRHGGDIEVESTEGQGTTVTIILPGGAS